MIITTPAAFIDDARHQPTAAASSEDRYDCRRPAVERQRPRLRDEGQPQRRLDMKPRRQSEARRSGYPRHRRRRAGAPWPRPTVTGSKRRRGRHHERHKNFYLIALGNSRSASRPPSAALLLRRSRRQERAWRPAPQSASRRAQTKMRDHRVAMAPHVIPRGREGDPRGNWNKPSSSAEGGEAASKARDPASKTVEDAMLAFGILALDPRTASQARPFEGGGLAHASSRGLAGKDRNSLSSRELQELDRVEVLHAAADALRRVKEHVGFGAVGIAQHADAGAVDDQIAAQKSPNAIPKSFRRRCPACPRFRQRDSPSATALRPVHSTAARDSCPGRPSVCAPPRPSSGSSRTCRWRDMAPSPRRRDRAAYR